MAGFVPGLECGARRQRDEDFSVGAAQGRRFQIMMLLIAIPNVVEAPTHLKIANS